MARTHIITARRRLLEALRSGKYEQGSGSLRTPDGFCCLGVACDVSGLGEWDADNHYHIGTRMEFFYLPVEVQEQLGIEDWPNPQNPEGLDGQSFADDLNDRRVPFPVIADAFEKAFRADRHGI